jgi:autotransporter-associated beta strand protein
VEVDLHTLEEYPSGSTTANSRTGAGYATITADGNESFTGGTQTGSFTISGNIDVATLETASQSFDITIGQSGTSAIGSNTTFNNTGVLTLGSSAVGQSLTVTGTLTASAQSTINVAGSIISSDEMEFGSAVILKDNTSVSTTNSQITFGDTVNSESSETNDLTIGVGSSEVEFDGIVGGSVGLGNIAITGALDLDAAITSANLLSVSTTSNLGANITTSSTQTYTGATTLSAADRTLAGSTINFGSTLAGGTNALTVTGNLDLDGAATGLSSLSVSGTSNLGGNVTTSGVQTYSDAVTLSGAARTLTTTNSNLTFSSTVNGAQDLTISVGTGDTVFTGAVGGSASLGDITITTAELTAAAIALQGTLDITNSGASSITGVISNGTSAASLTKSGTGTLTLSGTNTYTGDTTIAAGTLTVSGQLGSGTYSGDIDNSATFTYSSNSNQTLSGVISGTGSLTKSGSSTLTLTGTNTYSGTTTISAGTLIIENNAPSLSSSSYTGAGSLIVQSASGSFSSGITLTSSKINSSLGNLTLGKSGNTASITISGDLEVAGNLTIYGPSILNGDITTGGNQSYTGNTTIYATDVNISSVGSSSAGGDITFTGNIDGQTADSNSLFILSGAGDVSVTGNVGDTTALNKLGFGGYGSTASPVTTNFSYTGSVQTYTASATGTFTLYVWGAQGMLLLVVKG